MPHPVRIGHRVDIRHKESDMGAFDASDQRADLSAAPTWALNLSGWVERNDYRHPRFIAAVPRRGYRFIPTFTNERDDPATGLPAARLNVARVSGPNVPDNDARRRCVGPVRPADRLADTVRMTNRHDGRSPRRQVRTSRAGAVAPSGPALELVALEDAPEVTRGHWLEVSADGRLRQPRRDVASLPRSRRGLAVQMWVPVASTYAACLALGDGVRAAPVSREGAVLDLLEPLARDVLVGDRRLQLRLGFRAVGVDAPARAGGCLGGGLR